MQQLKDEISDMVNLSSPMNIVGDIYDMRFRITYRTIEEFLKAPNAMEENMTDEQKELLGAMIYWLRHKERDMERKR